MKQKNSLVALVLALFLSVNVFSQNIESVYLSMPDALNPTLSSKQRHELIEYFKVNQSDSVLNRFGTQSKILALDTINQQLIVQNTAVSTHEMMLFYTHDSLPLVGVINTVCAPLCHSTIQFYDTAWRNISIKFDMPKSIEWLNWDSLNLASIDKDWVENILENNFIKLKFDGRNKTILADNQSLDFISDKDKEIVKPLMKEESFIYRLKDKVWIR